MQSERATLGFPFQSKGKFDLPIYAGELENPNLFGVVRSQAFAPVRRFGQYFLYKWYWMRDEKFR